jgi:plasmid maintenance system antidote protein VapI
VVNRLTTAIYERGKARVERRSAVRLAADQDSEFTAWVNLRNRLTVTEKKLEDALREICRLRAKERQ